MRYHLLRCFIDFEEPTKIERLCLMNSFKGKEKAVTSCDRRRLSLHSTVYHFPLSLS